jgi:hypothetical protein
VVVTGDRGADISSDGGGDSNSIGSGGNNSARRKNGKRGVKNIVIGETLRIVTWMGGWNNGFIRITGGGCDKGGGNRREEVTWIFCYVIRV